MTTEDTSAENSEDDNGKETDGLPHHRIEAMEDPVGETGHDYWNMWWMVRKRKGNCTDGSGQQREVGESWTLDCETCRCNIITKFTQRMTAFYHSSCKVGSVYCFPLERRGCSTKKKVETEEKGHHNVVETNDPAVETEKKGHPYQHDEETNDPTVETEKKALPHHHHVETIATFVKTEKKAVPSSNNVATEDTTGENGPTPRPNEKERGCSDDSGRRVKVGETFWRKCNTCRCAGNGATFCTRKGCRKSNKIKFLKGATVCRGRRCRKSNKIKLRKGKMRKIFKKRKRRKSKKNRRKLKRKRKSRKKRKSKIE